MKVVLHSFTEIGLDRAARILAELRTGELDAVPASLLDDAENASPAGLELPDVKPDELHTRWHLALWLQLSLSNSSKIDGGRIEPAHWSWLAMRLFDVLAPVVDGKRKVREDARYLLQADDYRKAYRHLLAGPYLLFQAHSESPGAIRGLLATTPDAPGEVYEQLASRKFLITSHAVVTVATRLYLDESTNTLRRGAGASGPGSARRLSDILQQLDKTYDMQEMPSEILLGLLPREFARFTRHAT